MCKTTFILSEENGSANAIVEEIKGNELRMKRAKQLMKLHKLDKITFMYASDEVTITEPRPKK